jgi:hypothetical protein
MAVTSRRFVATMGMATIVVSRRPPRRRTRDLGRSSGRNAPGSRVRPPWLECGRWPGRGVPRRLRTTSGHDAALAPLRAGRPPRHAGRSSCAGRQVGNRAAAADPPAQAPTTPIMSGFWRFDIDARTNSDDPVRSGSHLYVDRAAPDSTAGSDMLPSRRRHQSRRCCSSAQQGRVPVASNVVSERRAERPPVSGTVYRRSRLLCRAPPPGRAAHLTTSFTGGTRCRPTPQLVEIDQCPMSSANHAVAGLA